MCLVYTSGQTSSGTAASGGVMLEWHVLYSTASSYVNVLGGSPFSWGQTCTVPLVRGVGGEVSEATH